MTQTQQKALSIGTLFLFYFVLFTFSAYANPSLQSYGNMGVDFTATFSRGTAFGSNYPNGNTNFTNVMVTDGNYFTPIVYDFNNDGQNEVMSFFSGNVRLYDNTGSFLDNYIVNGTICGNGAVINYNGDQFNQVIFQTSASGGYYYYILGSYGTTFSLIKSYFLNTSTLGSFTSNCDLFGGVDNIHESVYSVNTNASVTEYYYKTDNLIVYPNTLASVGTTNINTRGQPFYHGGICAQPISNYYNTYFATTGSTYANIVRFDSSTNIFTRKNLSFSASTSILNVFCGNIGNPLSTSEIIVTPYLTSNSMYYNVYSYDLTSLKNNTFSGVSVGTTVAEKSNPVIVDVNKDSANEYCIKQSDTQLYCYNNAHVQVLQTNFSVGELDGILSMGLYDNTSSYLQLMSSAGMFNLVNDGNASLIYSSIHAYSMPIPVGIENSASFKKDLLYVSELQLDFYISAGEPAVCGNNICEYSENQFTCPVDCIQVTNNTNSASAGTVENFNACQNNSWCISGICTQNQCVGREAGATCTQDLQCGSLDCDNNNICVRSGLSKNIRDFFVLAFGGGFFNLLLYGLIIILISAVIGALLGGASGNPMIMIGLSVVFGFIGLLISTLVLELIPVWFLFVFLVLIIGSTLMIMVYSGRS